MINGETIFRFTGSTATYMGRSGTEVVNYPFTFAAWIKPGRSTTTQAPQAIFSRARSGSINYNLRVFQSGAWVYM